MNPRPYHTKRAWLHRKGRKTWEFEMNLHGQLFHRTARGTTYLIMPGIEVGKPFWIGQQSYNGTVVFTVEKYLRAQSIEFDNGGIYTFPTK